MSHLGVFAGMAVGYALLATSAFELFGAGTIGVTFFPPAGLTVVAFLLAPRARWPAIAAAIVVGEVVVDVAHGQGLGTSMGWAVANLVEPLVAAVVIGRLSPVVELTRRFALVFAAGGLAAGPACGAAVGATVLATSSGRGWLSSYLDIWVGDGLGVLVVAPAILVFARPEGFVSSRPNRGDPIVVGALMVAVSAVLFFANGLPVGYAVLPVLALTAVRYGPKELAIAAVVVTATLTAATAHGRGPWAPGNAEEAQQHLLQQQVFLLLAITGMWLLELEVRERTRAVRAAQAATVELQAAAARELEARHLAAMYDAVSDLAGAASSADIAAVVAAHGPAVLDATTIVVLLEDPARGGLAPVAPTGGRPLSAQAAQVLTAASGLPALATRTGRPLFGRAPAGTDATNPGGGVEPNGERLAPPLQVAGLPVTVSGRRAALGVARSDDRPWTDGDQLRAIAFASIVADALERTEQAELDRRIALTLQEALMPPELVAPEGYDVAGRYLPASASLEVGGDWYDVIIEPGAPTTVVIGDVVGHNVAAAAAMGKLAAAARALGHADHRPAELLEVLDRIADQTADAALTTMVCASLGPPSRGGGPDLRYSCAGHPPPLLRRPDGTVEPLQGAPGKPLAILAGPRKEAVVELPPGSVVLFYTDGLVDRRDLPPGDQLERLGRALAAVRVDSAAGVCDQIVAVMLEDRDNDDDVALLCLVVGDRRLGGPEAAIRS